MTRVRKGAGRKENGKTKKIILALWGLSVLSVVGLFVYFLLLAHGILGDMPTFEQLENPKDFLATEIYSSDGQLLGTYFRENRSRTSYEDLSKNIVEALIATEDVRFYDHSGIDFKALPRVVTGIAGGSSKGGGSTITQQLAKMLFPRDDNMNIFEMINRKFKEWIIAVRLERNYTKEEIIEMYLNKFDFLNLAVGIESAARVYFDTVPAGLSRTQAAMLVGMAKNPSLYNPIRRPDETLNRRNVVIDQLLKYQYITQQEHDSLSQLPLGIRYQKVDHNIGSATYFREFIRLWLTAKEPQPDNYIDHRNYVEDSVNWYTDPSYGWCNKNTKPDGSTYDIYTDGLQIYTTIDSRMQKHAEAAVVEHIKGTVQPEFFKDQKRNKKAPFSALMTQKQIDAILNATMRRSERWRIAKSEGMSEADIEKSFHEPVEMQVFSWNGDIDTVMTPMDSLIYYKYFLRAGFMAMDPHTGHVKAYVGGTNYKHFKFDQITKSRRQVGSTIKPFIYCLAMQNGISPCTKVPNVEVTFKLPEGSGNEYYTPRFSHSKSDGQMITLKRGLAGSLNQISAWALKQSSPEAVVSLVKKMGVYSHIDPFYSICVGAAEVLLSEMVGAYCTFANKGIYTRPQYITHIKDNNGNVLAMFTPNQKEALSEETAYLMIELMKGVVDMGTGGRLRFKYGLKAELAGKTGTTNDNSDGWFIGIAPDIVAGAWVGGEERGIRFISGSFGQGSSLALPIYALFMKRIYGDKKLPYSEDTRFEKPVNMTVETDCDKYERTNRQQDFNNM